MGGPLSSTRDQGVGDTLPIAQRPVEHTGFFENIAAGYRGAKAGGASTQSHQNAAEAGYYNQVVAALNAAGERTTDPIEVRPGGWGYTGPKVPVNEYGVGFAPSSPRPFQNPYTGSFPAYREQNPVSQAFIGGDPQEMKAIWDAVQRVRQRNPGFLKDFPDPAAITARALQDRARTAQQSADVYSRANLAGTIGSFIGGVAESPLEPESYIGGIGGAAGKTIGRTILKRALEGGASNLAAGVAALPGVSMDSARIGQPMSVGDDIRNVAEQGAFGAIFSAAHAAAPHVLAPTGRAATKVLDQAVSNLPEPIRNAAIAASIRAGTVDDRAAVHEFRKRFAPYSQNSIATPDETAAANVVERDADVREASPLQPGADGAHAGRLDAVMKSLGMDAPAPPVATPAPRQTATAPIPAAEGGGRRPVPTTDALAAIDRAEGTAKNPHSSATGTGQFINRTWLDLYKRHIGAGGLTDAQILAKRADPEIGRQMTAIYASENAAYLRRYGLEDSPGNLSLAHFLGPAGAKDVLRAPPDARVESLLPAGVISANEKVLRGKTAGDVIQWAHKRIGAATDLPVARPDAVPQWDPQDDAIPEDLPPIEHAQFSPDELTTDAGLMQYKSGGDASGVTDRLQGVQEWNPLLSGKVIVWEGMDGRKVIVDGHQRLGLAQRLSGEDPNIKLDAVVMREADGVTAQQARVMGALKNIAEGSGTAIDAARVLREAPAGERMLPPRAANVRTTRGLVGLSHEAFGAVLNDVIDPETASAIGRIAPDQPDRHMALVSLLRQADVQTVGQAETVVRQALADGFGAANEHQLGMFGPDEQQSLYGPSARILEAAKRQLKAEKRSFKTLTADASRIEQAGNVLDRAANEQKVVNSDQAIAILDATAHSAGPVRTALLEAARASLHGDRSGATRQFLTALEGIDLRAAARGVEEGDRHGGISLESGSEIDAPQEDRDVAGRGGQGESLFDQAVSVERAGERFSDPVGEGAKAQADSLEHDVRMQFPPANTRNKGVFYHGARDEVPSLTEGYYNPANIYGGHETFYTTDAADIASGYGRKRAGAKVYRVTEKAPVNFFDMEERHPEEFWNELFGLRGEDTGLVPVAIEEAETPNLRSIMDEIRNFSQEEGVNRDEVQEIFDTAIYNLRERGFGGMTHIGGLKTAREPHTVRIYFDAPSQIDLHDVTPGPYTPVERATANAAEQRSAQDSTPANPQEPASISRDQGQGAQGTRGDAADQPTFRLTEDGDERTAADILKDTDSDEAAIAAIESCLKPGGGE